MPISFRQKAALEVERLIRNNHKQLHPLKQLFWECTLRCTLKCRHCGSDCKVQSMTPDMPAADFIKVIDSLLPHIEDPHKLMIIITGGEPLMRKDLEVVGTALKSREMPWGMVTNGMLLTQERLDSLMRAGLHSITVSLDGMEADHNWMRGHKDSFTNAMRAIRLISKTRLAWDVVTCVNSRNIAYLPQLKELLFEAGVRSWRLFTIFPVGRAAQYPEFQLSDDNFRRLLDFIKSTRKEGRIDASYACEGFLGEYEGEVRDHLYRCNAGISVASVLADGSISACASIRSNYIQGNIYHDDFWDVWENRFQNYRNREWAKNGECADCKMFRYCEGNGMHLHDDDGKLLVCHYKRLNKC